MTAWKKYVLRKGKDKRENLELQIAFSLFCHQPQYQKIDLNLIFSNLHEYLIRNW